MTPTAKAHLHEYCETKRRERVAREGQAPNDRVADIHVFWFCMVALVATVALMVGQKMERDGWKSCPTRLEDGRFLMAEHWGVKGAEKCVYQAPKGKWKRG